MATEDFTFPTFTDALSSAVDSPQLWSLSPAASPNSSHSTKISSKNQEQEECKSDNFFSIHNRPNGNDSKRRKSFSWIERSSSSSSSSSICHKKRCEEDQDNKMDMLWEDFNEDLISSLKKRASSDDNYINYMGCVQLKSSSSSAAAGNNNLRLSKIGKLQQQHRMNNNNNNKSRNSGFVIFIKVLKKLVFNKSHMNIVPRNHCYVHPRQPHHVKLSW